MLASGLVFEHCLGSMSTVADELSWVVPAISKLSPELDTSMNFIGSIKSTFSGDSVRQDVVAFVALSVSTPSPRAISC